MDIFEHQKITTLLKLIFVASFILITTHGFSQEPVYKHYTTSNGLSSSEVYDIIQDDWGYIWFSTDNGLTRYDGYTFKHYGTSDGLTNNTVFKFFKDKDKRIWCTTFEPSVFLIVGEDPKFIPYQRKDIFETIAPANVLDRIYFDSLNTPIFTFLNAHGYLTLNAQGGIESSLMDHQKGVIHYVVNSNQETFAYSSIEAKKTGFEKFHGKINKNVCEIKEGRFGVVQFSEFNHFLMVNDSIFHVENGERSTIFSGPELIGIDKLDSDHFSVLTRSNGAIVYNKHGVITQRLLPGKSVSSMYVDHENGTWVSTLNDGVFYFRNTPVKTEYLSVEFEDITDIAFDDKKRLWIATQNGDVLIKANNEVEHVQSSKLKRPAHLSFDKNQKVMYYHADGRIWKGKNEAFIDAGSTSNIKAQKNGSVLIFEVHTITRSFFDKKRDELLLSGFRSYDAINYKKDWYFATKKGLFREKHKKLSQVEIDLKNHTIDTRIEDLCLFRGNLLIASRGNGIVEYDGNKILGHITTENGLTSNFVSKMLSEGDHTLWVCTNIGLNRIHAEIDGSYSISSVTFKDGLSSNEINSLAICDDTIWVGTKEGLNYFPRSYFDYVPATIDYRLKLRKVLVNDKMWTKSDTVQLSYDQNRLEFHFSGISLNPSEKLIYRYKFEGVDKHWTYTTSRSATYPKLIPGNYTFLIQVKGENTEWRIQEARMFITIHPPFWKQWWFKLSVVLSVILLIYVFFHFRVFIYNKKLVRELPRQVLKRLGKNSPKIIVREGNSDVKIETQSILFVKSDRNYLEIHTETGRHVIRETLSNFLEIVPDPLDFIRVRRSYIVRIDKVTKKGKKHIYINDYKIDVGETYISELKKISF